MLSHHLRAFFAVLPRYPIKALAIAWWHITGRRVRAIVRLRAASAKLPQSYRLWIWANQPVRVTTKSLAELQGRTRGWPALAVHLHLDLASGDAAYPALRSVLGQFFDRWELYITSADGAAPKIVDDKRIHVLSMPLTRAAALAQVIIATNAPWIVPLGSDCVLTPGALLAWSEAIDGFSDDGITVVYADQDECGARAERCSPWFKPEWDEDLFLAQDFMSAACAISTAAAGRVSMAPCSDAVAVYALLARLLLEPGAPAARRVPYVAVTTPAGAWRSASPARAELVRTLIEEGNGTRVTAGPFGTLTLTRPLPEPPPLVSVIVPTRDRLDLLATCVDGVLNHTDYPAIELIIADNGSVEPETLTFLDKCARHPRVKVVRWPRPYNYSAINNFAVSHANGSYLCLLNNDTEVIDAGWLTAMVSHAVRPGIGAVGARLLYPDRTIQHAGVVIGMGGAAGHAHRGLPEGEAGYFAQALIARGATAVTAACLVVAKDKFEAVGCLDEQSFAIAYNDVDLCLKLRAAGWRNIYVPQAVLIHHEGKSRGLDFAPEHLARYMRELAALQERWGTVGFVDPTHHPALDLASEEYSLML
jgi:GT2 family glycosyltransferase